MLHASSALELYSSQPYHAKCSWPRIWFTTCKQAHMNGVTFSELAKKSSNPRARSTPCLAEAFRASCRAGTAEARKNGTNSCKISGTGPSLLSKPNTLQPPFLAFDKQSLWSCCCTVSSDSSDNSDAWKQHDSHAPQLRLCRDDLIWQDYDHENIFQVVRTGTPH